jgi:hypothetical protein
MSNEKKNKCVFVIDDAGLITNKNFFEVKKGEFYVEAHPYYKDVRLMRKSIHNHILLYRGYDFDDVFLKLYSYYYNI